jgi:hypothetical protein
MAFFEMWIDLPRWVRACIALSILTLTTYLFFSGVIWVWGWVVGGVLLTLSLPRPMR